MPQLSLTTSYSAMRFLIAFLCGVTLCVSPKAMTILLVLATLIATATHAKATWHYLRKQWRSPLYVVGAALLGMLLLSASWSIVPDETVKDFTKLVVLGLAALLLHAASKHFSDRLRTHIATFIKQLACTMLALLLTDLALDGLLIHTVRELFGNDTDHVTGWAVYYNRSITLMAGFVLLACGLLMQQEKRLLAALLCAVTLIVTFSFENHTAILGMAGALVCVAILYLLSARNAKLLILGGALFYCFAFPIAMQQPAERWCGLLEQHYTSSEARLHIWSYIMQEVLPERPLLGHGFGSSGDIGFADNVQARSTACSQHVMEVEFHHAHNALLQIATELGIIGMALYAAFVLILLKMLPFGTRSLASAATCSIVPYLLITQQTGYSVWQSWYVAFILIGLILYRITSRQPAA